MALKTLSGGYLHQPTTNDGNPVRAQQLSAHPSGWHIARWIYTIHWLGTGYAGTARLQEREPEQVICHPNYTPSGCINLVNLEYKMPSHNTLLAPQSGRMTKVDKIAIYKQSGINI